MGKFETEVATVPTAFIKAAREWGLLQRELTSESDEFVWTEADTTALQFFIDTNRRMEELSK